MMFYSVSASSTAIAAACALAASLNSSLGGERLGAIIYIERTHRGSSTAVLSIATHIACCLIIILLSSCATGTASAASAAACAYAGTATATAIATSAAIAGSYPGLSIEICVAAVGAIAAVGSVAACGDESAAADDVERVARCQFNARAGTYGSAGMVRPLPPALLLVNVRSIAV